jgi:hypothetical protein
MRNGKIKTTWASLCQTSNGDIIVCIKYKDSSSCIRFESLEHLKQVIENRSLLAKNWVIPVPRNLCILKTLALPASDLNEAAKMVEFELPSLIPLPSEQIVYGCTPLNKQDNMLNILVCIIKLDTLNRYLEPYRAIKIEPRKITLDSLAIQSWFKTTDTDESGAEISIFANQHRCVVMSGIDGDLSKTTDLFFFNSDLSASSRKIAHEILRQQEELKPSLKKKIIISLAGTQEYVSEIKNTLHSVSNHITFEKIITLSGLGVTRYQNGKHRNNNTEDNITDLDYEAVVAVGLLKSVTNPKLQYANLLPQKYIKKSQLKILLFNYLLTAGLSVLLVLLLWLSFAAMNRRVDRLCRKIETRITPIENVAKSVDSKRQRLKAIQQQLSNRGQATQIIYELYKYTPKNISINELRFISKLDKANIEIKGQSDLLANAFEYTDAMSKADLLSKIQIVNAQQVPRPGGSIVEFKAECIIQNH